MALACDYASSSRCGGARSGTTDTSRNAGTAVQLQTPGDPYDFGDATVAAIDARSVVRHSRPPTGAHSGICHSELAWVVVSAAGLR
jgi:hypothetical protein